MNRELISGYVTPMTPIKPALVPEGRLRQPVSAVIFDVYGTLFISGAGGGVSAELEKDREAHLQRLIEKYDLRISIAELFSAFRSAVDAEHAGLRARGVAYPEVDIENVWRQVLPFIGSAATRDFAVAFEFIVNPVFPMPGLRLFLTECRRRTAAMGIISNAQFYTPYLFEWLVGADLTRLGFDAELVLLSYRLGCAKPSPELFEEMASRLRNRGIEPHEALFVGNDMLKDIHAAGACGFQTALFAGDERSLRMRPGDPRCTGTRPDLLVTGLDQLLDHLDTDGRDSVPEK